MKLFYLTGLITPLLLICEWMGSFLKKNDLLRYWSNLSKLNWIRALILTIAKTVSKKIETLISCLKFLCLEVALYFFKGTIRPCMENYLRWCIKLFYSWNILDKLQKRVCRTVALSLISLMNPCFVVEMYLVEVFFIGITLVDLYLNYLNCFCSLFSWKLHLIF